MLVFGVLSADAAKGCQHYSFVETTQEYVTGYDSSSHTIRTEYQEVCVTCHEVRVVATSDRTEGHSITIRNVNGRLVEECLYCDYSSVLWLR